MTGKINMKVYIKEKLFFDGDVSEPFDGHRFKDDVLLPALKHASKSSPLVIGTDTTMKLSGRFLHSAFGGLVREAHYKKHDLKKLLVVKAQDADGIYKDKITHFIDISLPEYKSGDKRNPNYVQF